MRFLKTNVLLRLVNSYIVDSPQPANLSYMWNFGSLLALCLVLQILTGVFLAMKIKYSYFFFLKRGRYLTICALPNWK